ncbi:MAG TPA: HD domain-containing phosphohydrolase [Treponemataceae bacterium]|nr:HD domain-containing phosphohydrolase [Treponemataceae bacterium]
MYLSPNIINSVFQFSPIGMAFICASSGHIVKVNSAYCRLLMRDEEQIVGKNWMVFTHPDDIIKDYHLFSSLNTKLNSHTERLTRYLRPDGSSIHVKFTITVLQSDSAAPLYLVSVENRNWFTQYKKELEDRLLQIKTHRSEVINSLVLMANFRDRETGGHLRRTSLYVQLLLEHSRSNHSFSNYGIATIAKSSMLHDIGKVGISDSILHKNGSLTKDEFNTMKTHTSLGALAISETLRHLPGDAAFIYAREIAEFHHEWWDGTGYPHGYAREEIPYVARVMAIADVYDALRSERPYKEPFGHVKSLEIILKESKSHFDPELCEVFFDIQTDICAISESVCDSSLPFTEEDSLY